MNEKISKENILKYKKFRLGIVSVGLLVAFVSILFRLYYIQVIDHSRYAKYSKSQYFQKVHLNQTRGKILDRKGSPLAITIPVKSAFAHPSQVTDIERTSTVLAGELGLDREKMKERLQSGKNFVWVKRKIEDAEYKSLKEKDLEGVSFLTEDKRFYPHNMLGARMLGFCGIDNQGLAGLEYKFDKTLVGDRTVLLAKKDALGRVYGYAGDRDPNERFEMVTTIDSEIQYATEKITRDVFERYQAKSAVAVVMEVSTGEVLAMAEQPELDPNRFAAYPISRYKSLAVTESFEPGSTFKVFVAAAALDSGVAKPDDKFNCEKGLLKIGENTIREAGGKSYDELTFKEVIVHSSNIGSIKVAKRLGEERFYQYIREFGFGSKTDISLPGESAGMLQDYKKWSPMSLASMSFGQEITATPIQLTAALSIIGNGGLYVKPHLVKEVVRDGKTTWKFKPPAERRVISTRAAKETIDMMIAAVEEGTGKKAYLEGYHLAGKTGTAQKYDVKAGQYSEDKHLASFMALFPAENPRFAILVIVDEPAGAGWGGHVAAPPAREIAIAVSKIIGIPSTFDQKYSIDWNALEAAYLKDEIKVERTVRPANWIEKFLKGDFAELKG